MWTMATCYAFASKLGALFPMGFGWGTHGRFLPCCCVARVTLRFHYKRKSIGLALLERWKEFSQLIFESPSSSRFRTITSQKKRCRSCEAKQKQYYVIGAPMFFWGTELFGHCFVLQIHLVVGNVFFLGGGGGKSVQEASNSWSNAFFLSPVLLNLICYSDSVFWYNVYD